MVDSKKWMVDSNLWMVVINKIKMVDSKIWTVASIFLKTILDMEMDRNIWMVASIFPITNWILILVKYCSQRTALEVERDRTDFALSN